jgi:hypothetical protein
MERLAGAFRLGRRGRGPVSRVPAGVRVGGRAGDAVDPAAARLVAEPPGPPWLATLNLTGGRTLAADYPVDPPLLLGVPLPRIAVRSLPAGPTFSLDLRLPTQAALLYVGVLHFTDGRSRPGRARVAGTWSAPTTTFWGTWLGASGQRGAIRVTLRQG